MLLRGENAQLKEELLACRQQLQALHAVLQQQRAAGGMGLMGAPGQQRPMGPGMGAPPRPMGAPPTMAAAPPRMPMAPAAAVPSMNAMRAGAVRRPSKGQSPAEKGDSLDARRGVERLARTRGAIPLERERENVDKVMRSLSWHVRERAGRLRLRKGVALRKAPYLDECRGDGQVGVGAAPCRLEHDDGALGSAPSSPPGP